MVLEGSINKQLVGYINEAGGKAVGLCGRDVFFFSSRRRHTRCSRDWSSDVCSSDLDVLHRGFGRRMRARIEARWGGARHAADAGSRGSKGCGELMIGYQERLHKPVLEIGRASCRERV